MRKALSLRILPSRTSLCSKLPYAVCPLHSIGLVNHPFQKTRRRTYRAHGRINPYQGHPCHVEIILSASEEQVERSKDKDTVSRLALTGLNRRQVARRRIEAARSA